MKKNKFRNNFLNIFICAISPIITIFHIESVQSQTSDEFKKAWEDAYYNYRDCNRAIYFINQAIKVKPKDAISYIYRGQTLRELCNDKNAAIADANFVINDLLKDPINEDQKKNLAKAYFGRAISIELIADQNWKKMNNSATIFETNMYRDKALTGFREAIGDYSKSISLDRKNVDTYYMRGRTYEKIYRKDIACYDYRTGWALGDQEMRGFSIRECGYDSPAFFTDIACEYASKNEIKSTIQPEDPDMNLFVKNECGF